MTLGNRDLIFVTGPARSGTLMLQGLICNHPAVARPLAECFYLTGLIHAYEHARRIFDIHTYDYFADRGALMLFHRDRVLQPYLDHLAEAAGPGLVVQKSPELLVLARELAELFPGAPIIVTVRDLRDIVASQATRMAAKGEKIDGEAVCRQALDGLGRVAAVAGLLPDQVTFVRYEALAHRPERTLGRAFRALGLAPPDRPALAWDHQRDPQRNESWSILDGRPPAPTSVGRHTESEPALVRTAEARARELEATTAVPGLWEADDPRPDVFGIRRTADGTLVREPVGDAS